MTRQEETGSYTDFYFDMRKIPTKQSMTVLNYLRLIATRCGAVCEQVAPAARSD